MKERKPQFIDTEEEEWTIKIEDGSRVEIEGEEAHGLRGHERTRCGD